MELVGLVFLLVFLVLFLTAPPFILGLIGGFAFRLLPPKSLAFAVGAVWGIFQFVMRSDMFLELIEFNSESMGRAGIHGPPAILPWVAAGLGWMAAILGEWCIYFVAAFPGVRLGQGIAKRVFAKPREISL